MTRLLPAIAVIFAIFLQNTFAVEFVLFRASEQGPQIDRFYNQSIASALRVLTRNQNLTPEEREPVFFVFSESRPIQVTRLLGSGVTTRVFEMADGVHALRVPFKGANYFADGEEAVSFINGYLDGYPLLRSMGVATPLVDFEQSRRSEYVVVERVEPSFTLTQFLKQRRLQTPKLIAELRDHIVRYWGFYKVGDFGSRQIVYVQGRGWVLLDWCHIASGEYPLHEHSIYSPERAQRSVDRFRAGDPWHFEEVLNGLGLKPHSPFYRDFLSALMSERELRVHEIGQICSDLLTQGSVESAVAAMPAIAR